MTLEQIIQCINDFSITTLRANDALTQLLENLRFWALAHGLINDKTNDNSILSQAQSLQ